MNNGFYGIIALKRNGSVWEWDRRPKSSRLKQEVPLADPRPVPELEPFRIRDLTSAHYRGGLFAETTEGQVLCLLRYRRRDRNPIYSFTQALPGHENLFLVDPQVDWRKIDPNDGDSSMVMNRDGTFWYYHQKNHGAFGKRRRGIDASSDWVTWNNMKRYVNVGLKSDGSFWYWRSQWVGKNKTLFESQGLT